MISTYPRTGSLLPASWKRGGKFNESLFIDWLASEHPPRKQGIASFTGNKDELAFYLQGRLYEQRGEPTTPF